MVRSYFQVSCIVTLLLASAPAAQIAQSSEPLFSTQSSGCGCDSLQNAYFRLHYEGGEMVGQPTPYSLFGTFVPMKFRNGLAFIDGQLVLDNDGEVSGNVGVGRRWYNARTDSIFGVNLWYDGDRTRRSNEFHQVGVGLEWLFDHWDFRTNVYAPLGTRVKGTGAIAGGASEVQFNGNNLIYGANAIYDTSLGGVDMEVARRIADRNLWGFVGTYHYDGPGQTTWGAKGGVRGYVTDNLAASLTISDDSLFDTTLSFGVTWFFPTGNRRGSAPCSNYDRLYMPVQRNDYIVAHETTIDTLVVLTDGSSPITVTHVNDDGVGTGSGTFEDPYGSVTDTAGSATDIVYVYADSIFDGQYYAMAANQRLLGEGNGYAHSVQTDQLGAIALPRATAGVSRPVILNAPDTISTAVLVAANTEISAFVIDTPAPESGGSVGANAIRCSATTGDVNINRNVVTNVDAIGINVQNITGNVAVTDNVVNNVHFGTAVQSVSATYLGNITGNVMYSGNAIGDADMGPGFWTIGGNVSITGNTVNNITEGNGMMCQEIAGMLAVNGNTISNATVSSGFSLYNSTGSMNFIGNTITNPGGGIGAMLRPADTATALYIVQDNVFSGTTIALWTRTAAGFAGTLHMNIINNTADSNYQLDRLGGGTFEFYDGGQVSGNIINNGATEVFTPF